MAAGSGRGDVGRAEKSFVPRRRPTAGPARGAKPAPRSVSGVAAIRGSGSHSKRIGTEQWSPYVNADGESVDVCATREFFDRGMNSLACTGLTMRTVAGTNSPRNYTGRGRRDHADEAHAHRLLHRGHHAPPRLMTRPVTSGQLRRPGLVAFTGEPRTCRPLHSCAPPVHDGRTQRPCSSPGLFGGANRSEPR